MVQSILFFAIVFLVYAIIEWYGWQAVKTALTAENHNIAKWIYWGVSLGTLLLFILYRPVLYKFLPGAFTSYFAAFFVILLFSKLFILLFLISEDGFRGLKYLASRVSSSPGASGGITRSQFLSQVAIAAAALPAGTLLYGVIANAYNFQFRKATIKFPNLPEAFNGLKIVHLSDIHSGSFTRTEPIIKTIEKINSLNADLILFTGDLVNNVADEMDSYMHIFDKLSARLGVFSVTGNHDYGDYINWSDEERRANIDKFMGIHKSLGWDLLLNENRILEKDGEQIALLGVEYWGLGKRWKKYGEFDKAYRGIEKIPFKILMSHDPSSWDARIRPEFPDIDLTLSGHTHGAQFGVESKWLKWSPSQYMYKQWAGLYNEGKQFLYVNRGFGFLGYPGRVGILPEVTEITLVKG